MTLERFHSLAHIPFRRAVMVRGAGWSMTVSGSDIAGTYEGTYARAQSPSDPWGFDSFATLRTSETYSAGEERIIVDFMSTVNCNSGEFPQGVGTYPLTFTSELEEYGCGDDASLVLSTWGSNMMEVGCGHGAMIPGYEHCGSLPSPAELTITQYNEEFIQGIIVGTFCAWNEFVDCFETISVSLEFTAIRELYQPF